MKLHSVFFLLAGLLFQSCVGSDTTTSLITAGNSINIVPIPELVNRDSDIEKLLLFSSESSVFVEDETLLPVVERWCKDMERVYSKKLQVTITKDKSADIVFLLSGSLDEEEHHISIENTIEVTGGSIKAVAQAGATLTQLATLYKNKLAFPVVKIKDGPDASYRGLMLDLARNWHTVESIKKCIDLAAFYKSNYVHLHFTDYQSYTLPSKAFPKLSTPDRHYTFAELAELETYAKVRGVILVPEIDVPGHASSIVEAYPEIFGIDAMDKNPYILNMGKEEVYQSLEAILSEIIPIFSSTPFVHIGGDEAIFTHVLEDRNVKSYMKANNLGDDVHDLYRHFILRVDSMVRRQGKQTCVWEGFRPEGKVEIPKNIVVFEFETNRYLPQQLVNDGYTVVNTAWKPLYVVNKKKFSPSSIYLWNRWYWANWWPKAPSYQPIQIEETEQVIGGQMCSWEQAENVEISSLRRRLPIMNERLWNKEYQLPIKEFLTVLDATDAKLSLLIKDNAQDTLFLGYDWIAEMDK